MFQLRSVSDNRKMEDALLDQAIEMAERTFVDPTVDHVCGLFSQLLWNWRRGLGIEGVGTVH